MGKLLVAFLFLEHASASLTDSWKLQRTHGLPMTEQD